ncbi:MAG: transposase family protein [Moorea sp. SIO1F2]|uniref:hypothetical protein n=1 Tax=Moorena sp. SIO1F2 TaxID=2607819 RepID=UPI0013BCBEC6|nr:hypothetical protein [Moorena sp. SIO1F2]NET81201.1 transposase family protein [Moorena sp. SIO1F2]
MASINPLTQLTPVVHPYHRAPALDVQQVQQQMLEHFEHLSDPLRKQGVLHPFVSIVMIALERHHGRGKGQRMISKLMGLATSIGYRPF